MSLINKAIEIAVNYERYVERQVSGYVYTIDIFAGSRGKTRTYTSGVFRVVWVVRRKAPMEDVLVEGPLIYWRHAYFFYSAYFCRFREREPSLLELFQSPRCSCDVSDESSWHALSSSGIQELLWES